MEFVGGQPTETEGAETVKIWYRCSRCKHSALLTLSAAKISKKSHAAVIDREHCTPYSKEKTFSVGEHIYHIDWDDVGKVVRKDKTSNGIHSIVVSFGKLGERTLLENIQSSDEEILEQRTV